MSIKYSVIIPSYNGGPYLSACIQSVLDQESGDFELIVSDDHSTDGSREMLESLTNDRLRYVTPPESMSMAEHWEWALGQSRGEWVIFVGQDDGLQPYFFRLADALVGYAEQRKLRSVMSSRAYFFWPGYPGDATAIYVANPQIKVVSTLGSSLAVLSGNGTYFDLPQGYTTSLVRRDLLVEAQKKQGGRLFSTHPQDANLAAIVCSLEARYLLSTVPLGWVGSSLKSAGLAIMRPESQDQEQLKAEYTRRVASSQLTCSPRIGAFTYGSLVLYFWGAIHMTPLLRSPWTNTVLSSKLLALLVLSAVVQRGEGSFLPDHPRYREFQEIAQKNGVSLKGVRTFKRWVCDPLRALGRMREWLASLFSKVWGRVFPPPQTEPLRFTWSRDEFSDVGLEAAGQASAQLFQEKIEPILTRKKWYGRSTRISDPTGVAN